MQLKRLLVLLLALMMVISMAACGGDGSDETTADPTVETTEPEPLVEFPLEQGKSYTVIMAHDEDWDEDIAANRLWRDLRAKTNVSVTIKRIEKTNYMEELNKMLLAGEKWDAIFTGFLTEDEYATLATQDYFLDISEMITNEEICPFFIERSLAGREDTVMNSLTTPDGGIYGIGGGNISPMLLESPILVNKTWVEKAGKKVEDIKTIEDLEFLLDYWTKNDMNGNGKKSDEIPYLLYDNDAKCNTEAFLGLYGIATTANDQDNYVVVDNGVVKFAPTTDAWKAAVAKLSDWYGKGYIWADAYKGTKAADSFKSALAGGNVGMLTSNVAPTADFVAIKPVKVSGYEAAWHIDPAMNNAKAGFGISKNCQEPEFLLAWFDRLLDMENSVRYLYGEQLEEWDYTEDGHYEFLKLTEGEKTKLNEDSPSLKTITEAGLSLPYCLTFEDYEKKIFLDEEHQFAMDSYKLYKSSLAKESWPRPYYSLEQRDDIDDVRADAMNLVASKKAQWITGAADINAQYDQFVKDLDTMGVAKMVAAMQAAYDVYSGK
jgi:putative aldouronate transport system substrate-binding protein